MAGKCKCKTLLQRKVPGTGSRTEKLVRLRSEVATIRKSSGLWYKDFFFKLYLAVLGLHCCSGFSLVVASGGYSLGAVHGLLIVVPSLVADNRL